MNYRLVYMRIVSHAKQEMNLGLRPRNPWEKKEFPNQYFEFHHILPKSLYPKWIKRKSNMVALTAREHFFCHQLLTKIYPCKQMYFAAWRMHCAHQNYATIKQYEEAKKRVAQFNGMKGKHLKDCMSPETYEAWREKQKNRVVKKESIEKWRESFKRRMETVGRYESEETKKEHFRKGVETRRKNGSYKKSRETLLKISKPVKCIEDNLIFESCSKAEKYYNVHSVSACVKNGGYSKILGKHFEYVSLY